MKAIQSFILFSCAMLMLTSCKKEWGNAPDFNVVTNATTYKVNDTVQFRFSGNADYLVFFSGEPTREYKHRERTKLDDVKLFLSFATRVQSGTQADQLSVVASTNFTGVYDSTNLVNATWTDITSRFVLGSLTTATPSTNQEITDLFSGSKPIYVAFKYVTKNQNVNGTQRNWFITGFQLESRSSIGTFVLGDQAAAAFKLVHLGPFESGRSSLSTTQITLRGLSVDKVSYTEDWAISKGFDPFSVLPDRGVALKSYDANKLDSYSYVYTKPGVYTATFVARNGTVEGTGETVKQVTITVNP